MRYSGKNADFDVRGPGSNLVFGITSITLDNDSVIQNFSFLIYEMESNPDTTEDPSSPTLMMLIWFPL